ncbi:uncharacterized protein PG986_013809, partial [Apiospora aurea]
MANFSSSGLVLLVFIAIFTAICGGFLLLRLWAARISRREWYLDDGFVLFAYANSIALHGVAVWAAVNGLGKSGAELTEDEIAVSAKLVMTSNVCWLLASVFVKMSLLWLFRRIFVTARFKLWSKALIIINSCYGIAFLPVYLTNCTPIDQLWHPRPDGHCRDMAISDYATVAINLIMDFSMVVLPLPPLWSLRIPRRKKVVVSIMFSFGFATIAFMIWRITATIRTRNDPDFTKHLALIGLISSFEIWFGIIAACIPTLGPLLQAYVKPFWSKASSNPSGAGSGSGSGSGSYVLSKLRPVRHFRDQPQHQQARNQFYGRIHDDSILRTTHNRSDELTAPASALTTEIVSTAGRHVSPPEDLEAGVVRIQSDITQRPELAW